MAYTGECDPAQIAAQVLADVIGQIEAGALDGAIMNRLHQAGWAPWVGAASGTMFCAEDGVLIAVPPPAVISTFRFDPALIFPGWDADPEDGGGGAMQEVMRKPKKPKKSPGGK